MQATTNDVFFTDSQGISYNSSKAGKVIQRNYNLDVAPVIIILATHDVKSPLFVSQLTNIEKLNAEKYGYLLVISNSKNANKSGYHTSPKQAKSILKDSKFKMIIYDRQGNTAIETTRVISESELEKHLTTPLI